jgi:glycosyltransferase involved in cell wall biosynthesis
MEDGANRSAKGGAAGSAGDRRGEAGPLRVLLIANTLPPADVSGVGEQVLQLAAGLREEGCEVEVLGRAAGRRRGAVAPMELAAGTLGARPGAEAGRGPGSSPEGAAGPKVLFPLTVVPAAWRALRRLRPHVVQVHESDGALAALLVYALRRSLSPRPRLVALLQVSYAEERRAVRPLRAPDGRVLGRPGAVERRFRRGKGRLQVVLGRLTARLADLVLAPSAVTAGEIERDYGVGGVGVLPNVTGGVPVSGEGAGPVEAANRSARGESLARSPNAEPPPPLGREPGQPEPVVAGADSAPRGERAASDGGSGAGAFLFVGRLRIRKGVEVLLEAVAELPSSSPRGSVVRETPAGASAVSASKSPPLLLVAGDGEHRAALESRAAELGLGERVHFLGRCDAARVRALIAACRALVVPSIYEGMPLVVLEAMEAGVPVVASRVSGIPEVVVDGETGWLVPPEDPDALAAALAEVLADPGEARRRGAAGRRRADERFRPAHAARRWLAAAVPGAAATR